MAELHTLLWVVLAGMAVGLFFDFYRIARKQVNLGRTLTFLGDILFSFAALIILLLFLLKANALAFRFYIFWGSLLGLFLYLGVFSSVITRVFIRFFGLLSWLGSLLIAGAKIPFYVIEWLMRPPYIFLRWMSMLIYRVAEALFGQPLEKQGRKVRQQAQFWKNKLIPPKSD